MLGRTHVSIGLSALTLLIHKFSFSAQFISANFISFFTVVFACVIGSLIPDLDHPESILSRKLGSQLIGRMFVLVICIGVALFMYGHGFKLKYFILPAVVAFFTFFDYSITKSFLPIIAIERIGLIIAGLSCLVLNYVFHYNILLYCVGFVFLLMGVLAHRGMSHSLLGFSLLTLAALFLSSTYRNFAVSLFSFKVLLPFQLIFLPFVVGMGLHLVADTFSDSGIPIVYPIPIKIKTPLTIETASLFDKAIYFSLSCYLIAFVFFSFK